VHSCAAFVLNYVQEIGIGLTLNLSAYYIYVVFFSVCSLSPDNTSETEPSDADITMATADSVTHVDSMDTDNIGHSSMVSRHSEEEIQHCLQRLLALG